MWFCDSLTCFKRKEHKWTHGLLHFWHLWLNLLSILLGYDFWYLLWCRLFLYNLFYWLLSLTLLWWFWFRLRSCWSGSCWLNLWLLLRLLHYLMLHMLHLCKKGHHLFLIFFHLGILWHICHSWLLHHLHHLGVRRHHHLSWLRHHELSRLLHHWHEHIGWHHVHSLWILGHACLLIRLHYVNLW